MISLAFYKSSYQLSCHGSNHHSYISLSLGQWLLISTVIDVTTAYLLLIVLIININYNKLTLVDDNLSLGSV